MLGSRKYFHERSNTMEEKKLVMVFKNEEGKQVTISVADPKEDLTEVQIKAAMDLIVEKNIFRKNDLAIAEAVEARIVNTQTTEYDLIV